MKFFLLASLSLYSLQILACPDLSGTYISPSKESIKLEQVDCSEIAVESKDINQALVLNNQYVIVQEDAVMQALGRGSFIEDVLVLEVKIKYKSAPPVPRILLPVKGINKYTQMPDGNLLENTALYNEMNGVITSSKTIYKKR